MDHKENHPIMGTTHSYASSHYEQDVEVQNQVGTCRTPPTNNTMGPLGMASPPQRTDKKYAKHIRSIHNVQSNISRANRGKGLQYMVD